MCCVCACQTQALSAYCFLSKRPAKRNISFSIYVCQYVLVNIHNVPSLPQALSAYCLRPYICAKYVYTCIHNVPSLPQAPSAYCYAFQYMLFNICFSICDSQYVILNIC